MLIPIWKKAQLPNISVEGNDFSFNNSEFLGDDVLTPLVFKGFIILKS